MKKSVTVFCRSFNQTLVYIIYATILYDRFIFMFVDIFFAKSVSEGQKYTFEFAFFNYITIINR
jgi:hypothetical protein